MNYKKFYKETLKIDYDTKLYHIHHIDGNRENNNINNLVLLPKHLHHKYHYFSNILPHNELTKLGILEFYLHKREKIMIDYLATCKIVSQWIEVRDNRLMRVYFEKDIEGEYIGEIYNG